MHEGGVRGQHGAEGEPLAAFAADVGPGPRVLVEVVPPVGPAVVGCRAVRALEGVPGQARGTRGSCGVWTRVHALIFAFRG